MPSSRPAITGLYRSALRHRPRVAFILVLNPAKFVRTYNGHFCKSLAETSLATARAVSKVAVEPEQRRTMKKTFALAAVIALAGFGCQSHRSHEQAHTHQHQPGCGHATVIHDGHTDYLDNGHLHHVHGSHVDEHTLSVNDTNPTACTPGHGSEEHARNHTHGPTCGHAAVPHGEHTDYLVSGHLHHSHGDHCDNHGTVKTGS
jgi:hypothetical protein